MSNAGCITAERAMEIGRAVTDRLPDGFHFVILICPGRTADMPPSPVTRICSFDDAERARLFTLDQAQQEWKIPE